VAVVAAVFFAPPVFPGGPMRTIFLTLLLVLAMTAPGLALDTYSDTQSTLGAAEPNTAEAGREQADEEAAAEDQVAPDQGAAEPEITEEQARDDAETLGPSGDVSVINDDLRLEPVGTMIMRDGTTYEIAELVKLDKYFIYIVGKLNGRSSTVISLTRLSDLQLWASIQFKDPKNFTIISKNKKELFFADARLYLGSDSATTYTFITTNPNNFQPVTIEVQKKNVQAITIK
jgi:hypothetical protein